MRQNGPGPTPALLFLILGTGLAAALILWMLIHSPWDLFAAQGDWLTSNVWGQISLLDLYSGFLLGLALVWLLEPSLKLRIAMTLLLPTLGNPILALWLIFRWRRLNRMATGQDFD